MGKGKGRGVVLLLFFSFPFLTFCSSFLGRGADNFPLFFPLFSPLFFFFKVKRMVVVVVVGTEKTEDGWDLDFTFDYLYFTLL